MKDNWGRFAQPCTDPQRTMKTQEYHDRKAPVMIFSNVTTAIDIYEELMTLHRLNRL